MLITAAAIRQNGRCFLGRRHKAIIRDTARAENILLVEGELGFVTDAGDFVDRAAAATIAFTAKQIAAPKQTLFSEDIFPHEEASLSVS